MRLIACARILWIRILNWFLPSVLYRNMKKENNISVYQHFLNYCEELGVEDIVPLLDRMIVLDYIIANEDRHLNNFGALRNAETLEWLGMAPVYDSGSALGYDKLAAQIRSGKDITCKPFKKHHEEQLKLVSSFEWIDFEKLSDIKKDIREVMTTGDVAEYMDDSSHLSDNITELAHRLLYDDITKKQKQ